MNQYQMTTDGYKVIGFESANKGDTLIIVHCGFCSHKFRVSLYGIHSGEFSCPKCKVLTFAKKMKIQEEISIEVLEKSGERKNSNAIIAIKGLFLYWHAIWVERIMQEFKFLLDEKDKEKKI